MPTCDYHLNEPGSRRRCRFFEIGMPRTGTRSICRAAQRMGLRARHAFGSCEPCERDALEKLFRNRCDFNVYEGCDYVGGISSIHWWVLPDAFPEAKFILTLRPNDKWCRSWKLRDKTTQRRISSGLSEPIRWTHAYRLGHFQMLQFNSASWTKTKDRHERDVIDGLVGTGRLLMVNVFEEEDGVLWKQLAEFFGYGGRVPVDQPFPNRKAPIRCNSNFEEFEDEV